MSSTLLIAVAMVVTIAAAVIILIKISKRDLNKQIAAMQTAFDQAVAEHELKIADKDESTNTIIAIDELKMLLLFVKYFDKTITYEVVPLTRVTNCMVQRKSPIVNMNRTEDEFLTETYLSFKMINNATIDLLIYKETQDGLYERMRLDDVAKKWQNRVNSTLITEF